MANSSEARIDPARRQMRPETWPSADRIAWEAALNPTSLSAQLEPAARWAPTTVASVAAAYGRWLSWLGATDPDSLSRAPAERASLGTMKAYVDDLRIQVSSGSVAFYVRHLRLAFQVVAPGSNWNWLLKPAARLARLAEPVCDKRTRIVPIRELFQLGIGLMQQAETATSEYARAVMVRDGLLIAFLALMPLRMANLKSIRLGVNLQERGSRYWLDFDASETKTRTTMLHDVPFPHLLVPYLETYLLIHRRVLLARRASQRLIGVETDFLWVSVRGVAMCGRSIFGVVAGRTEVAFGHAINPHLFRDCVATSLQIEGQGDGTTPLASRLLSHATPTTTRKHYSHGQMADVVERYQAVIAKRRRRSVGENS